MTSAARFLQTVEDDSSTALGRARAVLWWAGRNNTQNGLSAGEICRFVEEAGHPRQNESRLEKTLSKDRTFVSHVAGKRTWMLRPKGRVVLDAIYGGVSPTTRIATPSDSILPRGLFSHTRRYLEQVVLQINASFDTGLYDCCAVMCRRLLETLIIELYEAEERESDICGGDGHYLMFGELLKIIAQDKRLHLSRNCIDGLKDFKKLGDLSAHSRRYSARREDITRVRDGMRIASEELLHVARLI